MLEKYAQHLLIKQQKLKKQNGHLHSNTQEITDEKKCFHLQLSNHKLYSFTFQTKYNYYEVDHGAMYNFLNFSL